MKSSTIRRSTLSRESIEVIEQLSKEQIAEDSIVEYVRPEDETESADTNKAQEIDLLWQNFKSTQFNTNSPTAYILLGFGIGVIVTAILGLSITGYCVKSGKFPSGVTKAVLSAHHVQTLEQQADDAQKEVENKVSVPSEEETIKPSETATENNTSEPTETSVDNSKMKKYIVKNGDTGESIIKHYYGSYSPERAEQIIKVNNLKSLDRINIDQELLIPVE